MIRNTQEGGAENEVVGGTTHKEDATTKTSSDSSERMQPHSEEQFPSDDIRSVDDLPVKIPFRSR